MPVLTVQCTNFGIPEPPPQISIPHFGILQKGADALGKIPDPMQLIAKFQDALAVALAPVRRFLEIVEAFMAVKNCITAIPEAIIKLSPGPVFDCIEELSKVLARFLSYIPPLSYVRLAMDICGYCIDLIDAVVDLFVLLDQRIGEYIASYDIAIATGDIELLQIVNCGLSELVPSTITALDLLKFIKPISDVLFDVFLRLIPSEQMQKMVQQYADSSAIFESAGTSLRAGGTIDGAPAAAHAIIPLPGLSPIVTAMGAARNAQVALYNLMAPMVGSDSRKEIETLPTLTYL